MKEQEDRDNPLGFDSYTLNLPASLVEEGFKPGEVFETTLTEGEPPEVGQRFQIPGGPGFEVVSVDEGEKVRVRVLPSDS